MSNPETERDWQRTANAIGVGLSIAGLGFGLSQMARRPEIAIGALAMGAGLTTLLWASSRRSR